MTIYRELYDSLLGSKVTKNGTELFIPAFGENERLYAELLDDILQILVSERVIKGNYYEWLFARADGQHKHKKRHRTRRTATEDFYDPYLAKSPEDYTIREQLALVKFYLYRRVYCNNFGQGGEQVG